MSVMCSYTEFIQGVSLLVILGYSRIRYRPLYNDLKERTTHNFENKYCMATLLENKLRFIKVMYCGYVSVIGHSERLSLMIVRKPYHKMTRPLHKLFVVLYHYDPIDL